MIKTSLNTALLATTLLAAVSANAVTIVSWDLAGEPGNQVSTSPTAVAPGITGLDLTRGAGLTPSAAGNSISASGWTAQATDYFSLGFTAAPGVSVNLESLFIGTRSSATGPGSLGLFYSVDSFASPLFTFNQAPGTNFVNTVVDLTALPDVTGAVEFRVSALGTTAANGSPTGTGGTTRLTAYFVGGNFDRDLQFTGTVNTATTVIPLPAAGWMLLSGLAALGFTSRRKP
ncbi:MAG: VPLPA-CTERM sorting domain-containing protein [Proteobacteria bacterium]|nr:VPLPA-CTERM sorting domain-containing protein [Burkholderiales bacterium]